jgi:DNA-binding SARP family transcriptional activator
MSVIDVCDHSDERLAPHPVDFRARLWLLRGFQLMCGRNRAALPMGSQRVVAFLALNKRRLRRSYVAGSLWTNTTDEKAHANLRSALWRLRRAGFPVVEAGADNLQLSPSVSVDLDDTVATAHRLAADPNGYVPETIAFDEFSGDLLPDWYDDWVVMDRERFRQLRLHALESLCEKLTIMGRHAEAVQAGLIAVAAEPLRESAHRRLMHAYHSEGNQAEVVRQYHLYRRLIQEQLGVVPSIRMRELVIELGIA